MNALITATGARASVVIPRATIASMMAIRAHSTAMSSFGVMARNRAIIQNQVRARQIGIRNQASARQYWTKRAHPEPIPSPPPPLPPPPPPPPPSSDTCDAIATGCCLGAALGLGWIGWDTFWEWKTPKPDRDHWRYSYSPPITKFTETKDTFIFDDLPKITQLVVRGDPDQRFSLYFYRDGKAEVKCFKKF